MREAQDFGVSGEEGMLGWWSGVKTPVDLSQCQMKSERSREGFRVVASSKAPPPTERRGVEAREADRRECSQTEAGAQISTRKSTSTDT